MNPAARAREVWATLKDLIRVEAPHLLRRIPAGADPGTIAKFEAELALPLPPLLRELYLLHDGIGMPPFSQDGEWRCAEPCDFLPFDTLIEYWRGLKSLLDRGHLRQPVELVRGPVKAVWWTPTWLPITHDGAGNHYCVD